jgi:hypothetical protein
MKKIGLLLTLLVSIGTINGMENLQPQKPNYLALLPADIKKDIVLAIAYSSTVEEAVDAIRTLTETNKQFNQMINDPITTRTIIRILAEKFNVPSGYIAQQLGTPGSQKYIALSSGLLALLGQEKFDRAEKRLQAGADIDFQPVDTYPMFCATPGTVNLLSTLDNIIYIEDVIINMQESLSILEAESDLDQENIKTHTQTIESYQKHLQESINSFDDLKKLSFDELVPDNIFKTKETFDFFIAKINEGKFKQAYNLIKPKEVISYNHGITAYYAIGQTDMCVIGANLSPIMYAIAAEKPILLEWLLKHKANPNLFMGTGSTALDLAIHLGNKDVIELLVKNGANVNQKNILKFNLTEEIQDKLNEFGLSLVSVDKKRSQMPYAILDNTTLKSVMKSVILSEQTPLMHLLLYFGYETPEELYGLVKLLLDNKANPNIQSDEGDTPLIILTSMDGEGFANIMELLLAHGADPLIKDNQGLTALDYMNSEDAQDDPEREEKIQVLENAIKKQQKK